MRTLDFTESLVREYARKIFGFAYSKTKNRHDAEDLSQEIILQLCDMRLAGSGVNNMDAYIWRICSYTWTNYLRRNKPHWESLKARSERLSADLEDDDDMSRAETELRERLRLEVAYLGRTRRDITVMYYYDGMKGDEIAGSLGIPPATVRWHLRETKIDLKERIEMDGQLQRAVGIWRPIRLTPGRNGWNWHFDPCGIRNDALMQNICWICHGEGHSIEEISRTLGVAAFYLEDIIERLLASDCVRAVGKNKYQTTFFIPGAEYQLAVKKFQFEKASVVAGQFYIAVKNALTEIRSAGLVPDRIGDNMLLWGLFVLEYMRVINRFDCRMIEEKGLQHSSPKRSDGTKGWVSLSLDIKNVVRSDVDLSDDYIKFINDTEANRIKMPRTDNLCAIQVDTSFSSGFREFGARELTKLRQVKKLIDDAAKPSEYDKEIIADLIQAGYVGREGGELRIMIPYFTAPEMEKVSGILKKHTDAALDMELIEELYNAYIEEIGGLIPPFVDRNERNHLVTSFFSMASAIWLLSNDGRLTFPEGGEDRKRLCTVMWET